MRISKALGTHFEPFLPVVMEPLLAGATQVTQFSIVDAEEDDIEGEVSCTARLFNVTLMDLR